MFRLKVLFERGYSAEFYELNATFFVEIIFFHTQVTSFAYISRCLQKIFEN